jgi:selenocysteine lyase/cysteine desulfurase
LRQAYHGTEASTWITTELTALLADGLAAKGYTVLSSRREGERSETVSFRHTGRPTDDLHARLQAAGIDVALCVGALRASPAVHNHAGDVAALLDALP